MNITHDDPAGGVGPGQPFGRTVSDKTRLDDSFIPEESEKTVEASGVDDGGGIGWGIGRHGTGRETVKEGKEGA